MQGKTIFHFFPISVYLVFQISIILAATDTIHELQSLTENQTLVSKNGNFELGLFTPGNSKNRYLGIWFKDIPVKTVVWVANRENPTNHSSVVLQINNTTQNILVLDQNKSVLWSATPKRKAKKNPILQLLDSGNLVLREQHDDDNDGDENPEKFVILWQSFDYPCDTLLPGMQLGKDLKTGLDRRVVAWKNQNDPSPGNFLWSMQMTNYPEPMQWVGSRKNFNSGPWNGIQYSGKPTMQPHQVFDFVYVSNEEEVYFMIRLRNSSMKGRMVLNQASYARESSVWVEEEQRWKMYGSLPRDFCDEYGACGPNGNCDPNKLPSPCECVRGFKPKSLVRWNGNEYAEGCVRDTPLSCKNDGFSKYVRTKVPDTEYSWLDQNMTLSECKAKCLRNCSCTVINLHLHARIE